MEVSDVRKQVLATIERAKRLEAERRARSDEAARAYPVFLERIAVPLFRQVANILKAERYAFSVFTPTDGVRRDFQVLSTSTLAVEKQAHRPDVLLGFRRWQSPDWKSRTLALR